MRIPPRTGCGRALEHLPKQSQHAAIRRFLLDRQKKAMWRLDFISSENSRGFHAGQEAARVLGESIDYSRQAQAQAIRWRAPKPPAIAPPPDAVEGVTPAEKAPPSPN